MQARTELIHRIRLRVAETGALEAVSDGAHSTLRIRRSQQLQMLQLNHVHQRLEILGRLLGEFKADLRVVSFF